MTNQENLSNKVAFVIGGARGIGRASALAFARQGAGVAVADVSIEGNKETADMIKPRPCGRRRTNGAVMFQARIALTLALSSCREAATRTHDSTAPTPYTRGPSDAGSRSPEASSMRITVGSTLFTATLSDNATAKAFKATLPLTANMMDLNTNEKYFDLAEELPHQASNPGTVHAGDLMLYGSNTLVLFYKTFSTSYSYTRIGTVDETSGLASALGSGNVTVKFE